ncbi:SDR family NAD(P)-dependent oxidoreductase [Actinokineospora sp.]|uniref:SDR family NAD(P)-dependent oxidoreductase n=1 Tax=Actinokineospora sp. TaxID=1872133 RepID=UPI0040382D6F
MEWVGSGLELLREGRSWVAGERPRRAGVSSFGLSGTNAHVIIEEPPARETAAPPAPLAAYPLLVSGRDESAVRAQASRWADWLDSHPDARLTDVAATAALRRTHFDYRAGAVVTSTMDAVAALRGIADGRTAVTPVGPGDVAVLFTGQGSQEPGMGRALYAGFSVFRAAFDEVCAEFGEYLAHPLAEVVLGGSDLVHRTEYTQPALFAFEVALFRLWESWGLRVSALAGHSVGELVAAYVADVLSLGDAVRLVAARGRLMQACPEGGAMVSVGAGEEEVRAAIAGFDHVVSIAGINTPTQTVISGDADAVDAVARRFAERGRRTRRLRVSHAFHSVHMDSVLGEFARVAATCEFRVPRIPIVSTVTGARLDHVDADYWVAQVRGTVRFTDALRTLADTGVFLECGPGTALTAMAASTVDDIACVAALGDGLPYAGAVALYAAGVALDWSAILADTPASDLPTYPFARHRYWIDPIARPDARRSGLDATGHPWLAAATALADGGGHLFTGRVCAAEHRWLADHAVHGTVLMPGTGLLELAAAAARALDAGGVGELTLAQPLPLTGVPLRLQVRVGPPEERGRPIEIHSRPESGDGEWTLHATGALAEVAAQPVPADLRSWPVLGAEPVPVEGVYPDLRSRGLEYGPAFRGLAELAERDGVAFARVVLPDAVQSGAAGFGLHPALLDGALHALAALSGSDAAVLLPFAWSGVSLAEGSPTELRVRVELLALDSDSGHARLDATDPSGRPVISVGRLDLVRVTPERLRVRPPGADHLYKIGFNAITAPTAQPGAAVAVVGAGAVAELLGVAPVADLNTLLARPVPPHVLVDLTAPTRGDLATAAGHEAIHALDWIQGALAEPGLDAAELIWVTRDAVSAGPDDAVSDLARAAVWGLVRAVRAEYPQRSLRLIDLGADVTDGALLAHAVGTADEPELVLREDRVLVPRLAKVTDAVALPDDPPWQLDIPEKGRLDAFAMRPVERVELPAGHVRVRVRAAGMNFRDVLNALDVVHAPQLGLECAGEVVAVGADVTGLRAGDRVLGLAIGAFGTEVVVDARMMVPIPGTLGFADAATVPLVFLTAHYALNELAAIRAGQRLVVHAAAGGVGMAAVQLAEHLGVEVYATASPGKWPTLRALGIPDDRIASSRDTGFERRFLDRTGGQGADAVLNALAGEFVDASLRLLPRGGHFLEMGKTDVRDAAEVAAAHPGVRYAAFDLMGSGPERIGEMLRVVADLLERGVIRPLPLAGYDVREAPAAFRTMAKGRHIGKIVLSPPRALDPDGTVLVTGGTGELGALVARHLVRGHGVRHLVLVSRSGMDAPGAAELGAELAADGAAVRVLARDVAQRADVAAALSEVDKAHPLTAVVHLAAVLDDGVAQNQDAERFARVLGPKLTGAVHLHELTEGLDLAAFVLFSSIAGTFGSPGQSTYAAANAFLDALAAHRRGRGLPGVSLAWGLWAPEGAGMTARLGAADLDRISRSGAGALTGSEGMVLFDAVLHRPEAHLVPVKLDLPTLRRAAEPPALFRGLLRHRPRQAAPSTGLRERLAALAAERRLPALVQFVQQEIAGVLGLPEAAEVLAHKPLHDYSWDSLMAVELRNRIARQSQIPLPSTLTYDYPTARAIAGYLHERLAPTAEDSTGDPPTDPRAAVEWALARVSPERLRHSGVLDQLLRLAQPDEPGTAGEAMAVAAALSEVEMDQAIEAALANL